MKRKIADWFYDFWYNNHTHKWDIHGPKMVWEKCRICGEMRNTRTRTPKDLFKDENK